MFTEKEIAVAINADNYQRIRQAFNDLACFLKCDAKITFNAIRIANGFESNPTFEKLIDGIDPNPPIPDDYREKRKYIRQNNWGSDEVPEEKREIELDQRYPELGFYKTGWEQERGEDNPNKK